MLIECDFSAILTGSGSPFKLSIAFSSDSPSIVLFGPSGSGKTLTLMALAGLFSPDSGQITINGNIVFDQHAGVNLPARKRKIGFVFQDYALFPHLTVRENVGFGLKKPFKSLGTKQEQSVEYLMELCGISKLADRHPNQISGGQRQRTALARALAPDPELLLLDEPFSALDQPLRARMRDELVQIQKKLDLPMVMVSHDPTDVDVFAHSLVAFGHGGVLEVLDYQARRKAGENAEEILTPLYEAAEQKQ